VTRLVALAFAALLAPGLCRAEADDVLRLPIGDPARRDRTVPVALDSITDASTGAAITPAELPKQLAGARLLLVGEEHTSMDSHRVELAVLEALHRSGRKVTIALEMFPYTEQKALDDWSGGRLSEDEFLAAGRWYKNWGYSWLYYRDVFLFARDRRLPMVAVNAPRDVVSAVRKKGFQGLTPEESAHIPSRIDTDSPEHLRLFKASFDDDSFHAGMDEEAWKAMLAAQCTWDATMAFHAVKPLARDADPKAIVVLLAGAGHVQYGLGIERQVRTQSPVAVASLIPVAVRDEKGAPVETVQASYANFVWGVPAATDPLYPELGVSTRPRLGDELLEVIHVEKDSPAARAGLKEKDILVSLDGAALPDRETLARLIAGKRWGDTAAFVVRRDGESVTVTVPLRRTSPVGKP
jgi:uncharacterized iron-regulated protein